MFCPSWVNKFVRTVAHALTVGPSGIIACVLLWKHPRRLGVYLLLAHGTQRQSHHKVVSRPTQNQIMAFQMALRSTPPSRLSCGLRFWMRNASLIFRSLFQSTRSIAFMPCQSISCGIDCSWTCSAMADLELCPSLIALQCSFFQTRSARKVSPTYSPGHICVLPLSIIGVYNGYHGRPIEAIGLPWV